MKRDMSELEGFDYCCGLWLPTKVVEEVEMQRRIELAVPT